MNDANEQKRLLNLLFTDELTRLRNRRFFREQVPKMLKQAAGRNIFIAFFMFDLDNFKGINDVHGHQAGDAALVHFANILQHVFQKTGTVIRFAGDEFIVVVPSIDGQRAEQYGAYITKTLAQVPLRLADKMIPLSCSIGVSIYPINGQTIDELFEKADEALYIAKNQGKNRCFIYPESGKLLTPEKLDSILLQPPIVGRDELLMALEKHLSEAGEPRKIILAFGPDGAGKSRLVRHAETVANKKLPYVLVIKGYSAWQSEPYGAAIGALRVLFANNTGLSEMVFEKLDDAGRRVLKPRISVWDTKEIENYDEKAKPDGLALYETLMRTLVFLRETGHGALLLDDVEFVDPPTLQLIDAFFGETKGNPVHALMTLRARDVIELDELFLTVLGSTKEIARSAEISKIELKPLKVEEIRQFVVRVFSGATFSKDVEEVLAKNSSGNPLFLREAMSFLLQSGKIRALGDRWGLTEVKATDVPESFEQLFSIRLKHMGEDDLKILKLASVLGERINPKMLSELAGSSDQVVMNALGKAKRALFIEETANSDEFVFSHKFSRSILYSMLSEEERTHYHGLAAEIEKKFNAGSLERVIGRLAYHYKNSGNLEAATNLFNSFKSQMESVLISEGTRRMLQKRIITSSMAKESPLSETDAAKAVELARSFKVAMQNLRLYPKENDNVSKSIDKFGNLLDYYLMDKTEALSISLTPEIMLFNGQPPPQNRGDARLVEELYSIFSSYGLQGVLFIRGVTNEQIVSFLEIFTRKSDEVSPRWDEIIEELGLENILPDRKIFVAVGERKIALDEKEILAQTASSMPAGQQNANGMGGGPMTDEQLDRLRMIVDEFKKDKDELLTAIRSGNVNNQNVSRLVSLLENTGEVTQLKAERTVEKPEEKPTETKPQENVRKDRYGNVLPDVELVKNAENDIDLAFNDLESSDTLIRAKAAAWLLEQTPENTIDAAVKLICSDVPIKTRKLAAAVIVKMGSGAVSALLKKITPAIPALSLRSFFDVADSFSTHPDFMNTLREMSFSGSNEILSRVLGVLRQTPGPASDRLISDIFDRSATKARIEMLPIFAERNIREIVPKVIDVIKIRKTWEQEDDETYQVQIIKTLGMMRVVDVIDLLMAIAAVPKPWAMQKTKPDSVRVQAISALRQFPPNEEINKLLAKLADDKNLQIRRAAGG